MVTVRTLALGLLPDFGTFFRALREKKAWGTHAIAHAPGNIRVVIGGVAAMLWGMGGMPVSAQVNVTMYHNDIGRTGQNLNETTLTTANVNQTQFGKLFTHSVDGQIYAQPLYMSGVTVGGATHNVVYVATENDSVYAFDATSNTGANANPLWQVSLLSTAHGAASGATALPSSLVGYDINPVIGITGTPVIDPTTGTLYVVSKSYENGNAVQRLHALDITSGAEKFNGPVVITATVPGIGNGSVNGTLTFDSLWENQRPGLLLLNGIVYVAFAAHGDNGPWHGWILGYSASTLAQTGAYCASPNGTGSGIWMSGAGLAADQLDTVNHPFGRMFTATGNGDYTAVKPYTNAMDYGDSHLNLDLTNGVPTVTDEFTTNQQATLDASDGDVGSGGLMVLPTQTTGSTPHLAVQAGKAGTLYLLNRDNLGGYNGTTDQVLQSIANAVGVIGAWSSPAYWNGNIYYWGRYDNLRSFPLVNGLIVDTPTKSGTQFGYPGATPSISANGATGGIVWALDTEAYTSNGPAILNAYDATNVSTELYSSSSVPTRDTAGGAVKFAVPTIANGMVYVGAATELDVYGLLSGTTQTALPQFSPGTESFSGTLSVSITDASPTPTIYYTLDGSTPTPSSAVYSGPISVTGTETITAVASSPGLALSAPLAQTYTDTASTQAASVTFSQPAGTYTSALSVTLSDTTPGAKIYYTTNNTTPTTSSTLYSAAIPVTATETITAIAVASGYTNSPVIAQTYTIQAGTGINFSQGFAASTGLLILNGNADLDDSRLQLTNGGTSEASTAWYVTPQNVQGFTTNFTFQLSNPLGDGFTFALENAPQGTAALGYNGGSLGYSPIPNSVAIKFDLFNNAGEGSDSTGLYVNGALPEVTGSIDMTSTPINLHSGDEMAVQLVYNGTTLTMTITDMVTSGTFTTSWTINIPATIGSNTAYIGFTGGSGGLSSSQKVLTWTFASTTPTVATPTFSVAAGTYTATQSVTISDTTAGATIYYTTNNTTPTTSSTKYTGTAISVGASETLQAIAVLANYTNSAVATAAYVITPPAATPVFSIAAGTYTASQNVTISDATPGATIYYTTNNTTPTTSSAVYGGTAISVSTSETLQAIAVATNYSMSATATAAYVITPPAATPVFSVAAGTYKSTQNVTISDATPGATIYYTTNNTTPTTSSAVYGGTAISVSTSETLQAIAVATNYSMSATATAAYVITPPAATPVFSVTAGTYTATQNVTISDATPGATIYYTTNNTTPTTSSAVYGGTAISVSTSETLQAIAVATNYSMSATATAAYVITPPAATPVFSVAAGTYTATQNVTISDATPGATIYYTTNNTTPTTSSAVYNGTAISVAASETLQAIAVATNYSASATAVAAYVISSASQVAAPVFSIPGGSYPNKLTVTLTDSTPKSTIYYTEDGTPPTTSSTKYTTAISIPQSHTVNAIAVAPGLTASTVVTAAYSLYTATPVISPAGGVFAPGEQVTVTTATTTAKIYYTTNGLTPQFNPSVSTLYTGPITVNESETLKVIAGETNFPSSPVISAVFTIDPPAPTPTFSPAAGAYTSAQTIVISDAAANATIYYTLDGSTPTTSSAVYTTGIAVSTGETINAIAVAPNYSASGQGTAVYSFSIPQISYATISTTNLTMAGGATVTGGTLQLSDGGASEARAGWYSKAVNVQKFTTDFQFQQTSAIADGMTFAIQGVGTAAVGTNGGSLGYGGIAKSVAVKFDLFNNAGEGSDSTGIYLNGAVPTIPAVDMTSSGVNLHSGDVMQAHITYDGTTLTLTLTDTVTKATFTTSSVVNIPSIVGANTAYVGFTGGTGGATAVQNVLNWSYETN